MKTNMLLAVLVGGLTLTVGSTFGQIRERFDIPFDFSIGNSTLPAGEYTAGPASPGNSGVLDIRSLDLRQQILVTGRAESAKTPNKNKLVFRCYGDQCFLSQISLQGQILVLPVDNREHEMARSTRVQEASIPGK